MIIIIVWQRGELMSVYVIQMHVCCIRVLMMVYLKCIMRNGVPRLGKDAYSVWGGIMMKVHSMGGQGGLLGGEGHVLHRLR